MKKKIYQLTPTSVEMKVKVKSVILKCKFYDNEKKNPKEKQLRMKRGEKGNTI